MGTDRCLGEERGDLQLTAKNHVLVVGAGGNIGSHVVPHLARMSEVSRITLVDHDVYEPDNIQSQDILPGDVGKPKALVQARRLRRIDPRKQVDAIVDSIENIPAGRLQSDLVLTGLDSMRARLVVNERARFLGIPWIDAGVDGEGLLVRINIYAPGREQPCAECGFSDRDYEIVEQVYPCSPSTGKPPATGAPSSVGGLAASLLAIECRKVLARDNGGGAGTQILWNLATHHYYVGRRTVNPDCRLAHDDPLRDVERKPCRHETTLEQLIASHPDTPGTTLRVIGQTFVTRLTCTRCGSGRRLRRLKVALRAQPYTCIPCGGQMVATGFDTTEELEAASFSPSFRRRSLRSLGVREGDIVRVGSATQHAYHVVTADCRAE